LLKKSLTRRRGRSSRRRNPSYSGIKRGIVGNASNLPRCVAKPNRHGLPLDRRGPVSGSGKGIQLTFLVRRFRGGKPADCESALVASEIRGFVRISPNPCPSKTSKPDNNQITAILSFLFGSSKSPENQLWHLISASHGFEP